jgi:hypothetical protein
MNREKNYNTRNQEKQDNKIIFIIFIQSLNFPTV